MIAYDVHISRYQVGRVLNMPGLANISLEPEIAVLRFETAPGCDPCGADFIESEIERMTGFPPLALIILPDIEVAEVG